MYQTKINEQYDLTIAYRIYPGNTKPRPIYTDDKFKIVEMGLQSFKESLGNLKVKIIFLLDTCPPEYAEACKKYFPEKDVEIREYTGKIGNFASFRNQLEILSTQDYSELVYFAEDDYIYLPNAMEELVNFMKTNSQADFATPYDHPDYYRSLYHDYPTRIILDANRHWRTGASATLSFITRKSILKETLPVFQGYSAENKDFCVWMTLTKINVWNIWKPLNHFFSERWVFGYFRRTWQFNWWHILFGKKYSLWIPMPTLATHLESDVLAPVVNWKDYLTKYIHGKRK